ncbi:MAG: aldo/keto reductase [Brevibacterium sp.]|uniref:aldo/keto reductase n=1 Tax=Brevibacterium sp. TaxID=1701 RepID=UPI003F8E6DD9
MSFIVMRSSGMGIAELTRYVEIVNQGESTTPERLQITRNQRQRIIEQIHDLERALTATEYKIAVYGGAADDDAHATLGKVVEAGITLLDTADVYGEPRDGTTGPAGTNEEMLAPFLAKRRDDVQLATKFGIIGLRTLSDGLTERTDGRPEYAHEACDASLRRLGVDSIISTICIGRIPMFPLRTRSGPWPS